MAPLPDNEGERCFLCGETYAVALDVPGELDPENSYPYKWYACCAYFRQQPAIPEAKLHSLYDTDYPAFKQRGLWRVVYKWVVNKRARVNRNLIKGRDILEIGCGTGEFLQAARKYQPAFLQGIELSPHAAEVARQRYGVNVLCGPAGSVDPGRKFDTLFLFHVIEHLQDPEAVLRQCKDLLREGGVIVIETPNASSLERDYYDIHSPQFSAPFHTFFFSPVTLQRMLARAGYSDAQVRFHPLTNTFSKLPAYVLRDGLSLRRIYQGLCFLLALPFVARRQRSGTITVVAHT